MITEIAMVTVAEGQEEAFDHLVSREKPKLLQIPGMISFRFGRGIENPRRFTFLVEWQSLELHQAAASNENFARMIRYFEEKRIETWMEHFNIA